MLQSVLTTKKQKKPCENYFADGSTNRPRSIILLESDRSTDEEYACKLSQDKSQDEVGSL